MSSDILGKVTKDGSSGFKAEKDRYHLYTAHGCPFAHRLVKVFSFLIPYALLL